MVRRALSANEAWALSLLAEIAATSAGSKLISLTGFDVLQALRSGTFVASIGAGSGLTALANEGAGSARSGRSRRLCALRACVR